MTHHSDKSQSSNDYEFEIKTRSLDGAILLQSMGDSTLQDYLALAVVQGGLGGVIVVTDRCFIYNNDLNS